MIVDCLLGFHLQANWEVSHLLFPHENSFNLWIYSKFPKVSLKFGILVLGLKFPNALQPSNFWTHMSSRVRCSVHMLSSQYTDIMKPRRHQRKRSHDRMLRCCRGLHLFQQTLWDEEMTIACSNAVTSLWLELLNIVTPFGVFWCSPLVILPSTTTSHIDTVALRMFYVVNFFGPSGIFNSSNNLYDIYFVNTFLREKKCQALMHDVISVRRAARTHRHWRTRTFLLSRECHCANLQMPTSPLKAPMSRLINGTSTQRCESTLPQYVFFFIFLFFLRPAQHITHAEPLIPGREKEKKKKKKNLWPGRAIKRKALRGAEPQAGGHSRRTGAVALQAAGVKYLCVTDVFIAFSAPQPAGRGFSSSPRFNKISPRNPSIPASSAQHFHSEKADTQRRLTPWHLRPQACQFNWSLQLQRRFVLCYIIFYEVLFFLKKVTWVEPCCCW